MMRIHVRKLGEELNKIRRIITIGSVYIGKNNTESNHYYEATSKIRVNISCDKRYIFMIIIAQPLAFELKLNLSGRPIYPP